MPRPSNKSELLSQNESEYARLISLMDSLTNAELQQDFPFAHRDRNVRDVVVHLFEWQAMFLTWYEVGMKGDNPEMPAPGFSWKMTPDLNSAIWRKHQKTTLTRARKLLAETHIQLTTLIEGHSNEELFEKRRFHWTGSTSLGSYLVSATSSHYAWANKLLKKFIRAIKS